MQKFLLPALFLIAAFILNSLLFPAAALAEEKTCYFIATAGDVYVTVNEKEPGGTRDTLIWEGLIKNGQQQLVKSATGKVSYKYRPANEDRSYGDNQAACQNDSIVRVP